MSGRASDVEDEEVRGMLRFGALVEDPDDGWVETPEGLLIPALVEELPTAVDLFAGAGGFSCGLHQAGFHVIGAVESSFVAAQTYMVNLAVPGVRIYFDTEARGDKFEKYLRKQFGLDEKPKKGRRRDRVREIDIAGSGWISTFDESCGTPLQRRDACILDDDPEDDDFFDKARPIHPYGCEHFWIADVRALRGREMLEAMGLEYVDCVVGGPPCQGFTRINKSRHAADPRNELVFEFIRLARELNAKSIIMENVPGIVDMLTPEGIPVMDVVSEMMEGRGYGLRQLIRKALGGQPNARGFVRGGTVQKQAQTKLALKGGSR